MDIRRATVKDAEQILKLDHEIINTTNFFIATPGEALPTLEMKQGRIKETEENGGITFVVEHDAKIVGFLVFSRNNKQRLRHVGTIAIGLSGAYTNQGLGTRLLTHLIEWAKNQDGLEKICLGVLSHNERAIHMYKKFGFVEEGRQIRQIKLENGEYVDDLWMALFL